MKKKKLNNIIPSTRNYKKIALNYIKKQILYVLINALVV